MFIHRHSTRLITGIIPFPKSDTIFQTPNTMLLDISTAITSDASFLHIPTFLSYDKLLLSWLTVSPFPPLHPFHYSTCPIENLINVLSLFHEFTLFLISVNVTVLRQSYRERQILSSLNVSYSILFIFSLYSSVY